jgi:omega-6 fatty acid desaturase (delta-12 desaturase)
MMSGLTQNLSELRKLLQPYENKNNKLALFLWVSDYFIFFFGQYCVVVLTASLKIIGSVITVIAIGKLFILGHDACHGALTSSKRLNYWLAQIAFLPAMTSFTRLRQYKNCGVITG